MPEEAIAFRPFKIPLKQESQFFAADNSKNTEFMLSDLRRSGLDPIDVNAYTIPQLQLTSGATAGYVIPYCRPDGKYIVDSSGYPAMYRVRMQLPEFSKEQRYTQPSGEQLIKMGLPSYVPFITPATLKLEGGELICAEGEKKAASVMRHLGLPAFGIGGCQMWRSPDGSGRVHPWILDLLRTRNLFRVAIVPDGDIFRYDICNAYGTFARALEAEGIAVRIVNASGKIDDLLVEWGAEGGVRFLALPEIGINDLVQSPASLIKRYNLAFRVDSKDRPVVHQHTANIERLIEQHPAFPKIWRNLDTNRVMIGDKNAQPDLSEMEIANYFQYNLGFEKVTHRVVYSVIQALSKRNARSPMLERIRSLEWDGRERLDTWTSRLWGVADSGYSREVSSKWLMSACARMEQPGCKVDWMLIVVGPQSTGKTSMPAILFPGNSLTLYGEHNDKDLHMLLHSALVVGFDELDSFGKREASNLKAMITRTEDMFRPPYGASVEAFPRRFTLYGCGNRHEFLQHDPSGYRRYAVLEVGSLLRFAELEQERDQLWAEAYARYKKGDVAWWEVSEASAQAEQYVVPNPMEDMIINWVSVQSRNKASTSVKDGSLHFTMTQLMTGINMDRDIRNMHVTRDVAAILKAIGAKQTNSRKEIVPGVSGRYYSLPVA
jgi:hypothetical protein